MSSFVATTVTAEMRRLRATRSTTTGVAVALALTALIAVGGVLAAGHQDTPPLSAHTLDDAIRAPAQVLSFVLLLIGVLASAGEYRHRTVVPTLLAEPRRSRVAAGKVVAVAALGALTALATAAVLAAVAVPLLVTHDAPAQDLAGIPLGVAALVVTSVGYGVAGVGLGLLLRNQTAALVTALIWQFVVERVLPLVLHAPDLPRYLPGGAAESLGRWGQHVSDGSLAPWQGGLVLAGYAIALVLAARVLTMPRDVT